MMMNNLEYSTQVDRIEQEEWTKLLNYFDDASIYQTWAYGKVRWGERNLSHIILRKHDEICSIAQLRIIRIPLINHGIAYLRWGPLWQSNIRQNNLVDLRQMLKCLKAEYINKRRLLLRIIPNQIKNENSALELVYTDEGLKWKRDVYRTIMLDLNPSLEVLRNNLTARWRRQLNKANKNNLTIATGREDNLFLTFIGLYEEMLGRKDFIPGLNINDFQAIQKELVDDKKMQILIAYHNDRPIAGIVCSLLGDTGIYLLGATGNEGLNLRGSYLLHWEVVKWLKESGAKWYDLSGYNPEKNPGVGTFKEGLSGRDVRFIGQLESNKNITNKILIQTAEFIKTKIRSA